MAMYMSMPPQDFRDDAGHCWGLTDSNSTPNVSSATTGTAKRKLNRDKEHVFERNRDIFSISKSLRSIVGLPDDHNISLSTDCTQSTRSVKRHKPNHAESNFLEYSNLDEPLKNNNTLNKISSSNLKQQQKQQQQQQQQQQSMGFLSRNSSNYRDFLENSAEFKAYPEMSSMCGMDETAFGMIPTFSPSSSTTITTTSPSAFHAPCPSCFHTPENERPSQNESLLPSLPATVSPTLFCNASYVNPLCNVCSVPSPYSDSSDSAGEFSSPPYIQSSAVSPLDGIALGSITKVEEGQGDKMRGSMGRDSFHEYFDDEQQSLDGNYTHKNIKQMSTVLSDLPGFDKVRWQSILQGTRSPEVGDREIQRRVKEAEIIGTRIFGGDTNKMFTSLMNQNLEFLLSYVCNLRNGKKRHKKLRQRLLKELQKED